jgi:tetratricopeptide (TPR) repeat protein
MPRAQGGWFMYGLGGFLLVVMIMSYISGQSETGQKIVGLLSAVAMIGIMGGMAVLFSMTARKHREEQQQLEAAEELVQLRRWPQAAMVLQGLLSHPTRTPQSRIRGLIYLTSVLARYHRFDDAILVQNHLLENVILDPGTTHALKLGRCMAMLREDHLVDADRAMSDLRRSVGDGESAGLALLEIYRDVKTGHPNEAIQIFDEKLTLLRQQLGHRVGDAYALVARAYDMLGREDEARTMFLRATTLEPLAELQRRYLEVAKLSDKYAPATSPREAA